MTAAADALTIVETVRDHDNYTWNIKSGHQKEGSESRNMSHCGADKDKAGASLPMTDKEEVSACSPVDRQRGNQLTQHAAALCAANCGMIVGLTMGWTSAALAVSEGGQGFPISLDEWSWVTSIYTLGAALGTPLIALSVGSLGRRVLILLVSPLSAVAWALHLVASQVWMLYVGRILLGLATAATSVAVPNYISEMSEPAIRGALSTYFEILLCLGILIAYVLGAWVPVFWMNVFCLSHSILHGVLFFWFPETPRWYLTRNRREEAKKSLEFFRGKNYDVNLELKTLEAATQKSLKETTGLAAFNTKAARKGLILGTALMVLQQITGVNAVTFYASKLFTEAGSFDAHVASVIVAFTELIAACLSMVLVDRLGRRVLLFTSSAVMGVSTGCLGTYFYLKAETELNISSLTWMPIIFVSVYMFIFSTGCGPVSWVFLGEIFPNNIKSASTALATTACWLSAFLVSKFYPSTSKSLGEYTCYWTFCGLCVLSCIFIYIMPETKGKTLEEIQADLSGEKKHESKSGVI